ncbi:MAG: carcinine hydrolase/isopenicillin-N N-acyltransferase family protein [Fimbriimonas sp.]
MRASVVALALLASVGCSACTIVFVARGGQVIAAGNEDEDNRPELSRHTIRFVPADKAKGTLGFVAFGYKNNPFSDESAMNEAGLFYDFNALDKLELPRSGKPKGKFNAFNEILTTCRTVDQAVAYLESIDLPYLSSAQVVIGDASGASAIVERHATTWRRQGFDYQIGTNFRTSATPVANITCERYNRCASLLSQKKPVRAQTVADLLKSTIATKESGSVTWYSLVCDLKRREVSLYTKGDFTRRTKFSLAKELKKGARKLDMEEFTAR